MKLLVSSAVLFALFCAFAACKENGPSSTEIREFEELERALSTLAEAPREDRGIRLEEVLELKTETSRVRKVKDLCYESYRLFGEVTKALDDAKKRTATTESLVAEARARKKEGKDFLPGEEQKLLDMGQSAADALKEVNDTLDRAEKAVKSCQDSREALRAYFQDI